MAKYYYLISSLPELFFETGDSKTLDFLHIRDYVLEKVSDKDTAYVYNLLSDIDNYNLITRIYGKNREWKTGGRFEFQSPDDLDKSDLPMYMLNFLEYLDNYKAEHKVNPDERVAGKYLSELWYDEMENSDNAFIAKWFKFDREVKNVLATFSAKQLGISAEDYLVKTDDITESLLKNTSPDFGLSRERDYMPKLFQILETQDLLERENKLDMFRWNQINEINIMEYFSVNVALGTLQKASIANRRLMLNIEEGKKMFRKLMEELRSYKL